MKKVFLVFTRFWRERERDVLSKDFDNDIVVSVVTMLGWLL